MEQNKTRILSTRPVDPSWVLQAAERGILLESVSFIETKALESPSLAQRITLLFSHPASVIFTSMNAVDAVSAHTDRIRAERPEALPWRIFCIGHATRERVGLHFGEASIAGTADSALALALKVMDQKRAGEEVLFFCGDQRRDELPEKLKQGGIPVEELIVYTTRQTARLLGSSYDGILFFSPSAVHSFFSANTAASETVLFAIGATTAEAIGGYSGNAVILSRSPAKDLLIRQAIDYFDRNKPM